MQLTTTDFPVPKDKKSAIKKLASIISNSNECSNLKLHYIELLHELGLVQTTTDPTKMTMIGLIIQRRSHENALEYILTEWIKRFHERSDWKMLSSAFINIGVPEAAIITRNFSSHVTSNPNCRQTSKGNLEYQPEICRPQYVYYRKPTASEVKSFDETDHLLDVEFGSYRKDLKNSGIFPLQNRKHYLKNMPSILFALICFQIITAFTIHLTMKIDGSPGTNSTLIFEHLHDHYDQLRSDLQMGIKKILDATYYQEYNGSDHNVLHVTSYLEYQKNILQYSRKSSTFAVNIDLRSNEDWPTDVSLGESNKITKLTFSGNVSCNLVSSILKETKILRKLVFTNTDAGICQSWDVDSKKLIDETEISLPELYSIYFENFQDCSNVYGTFSQKFVLKKLQEIHFINGSINESNIPNVQRFIRRQRNSLKMLYFNSSKLSPLLFNDGMPTVPFVTSINLDSRGDQSHIFIGIRFSQIFPNLTSFVSERGHLPLSQILRLFDCENLITLKIGVVVDARKTRVNLDFVRNAPESLKKISLYFKFVNKTRIDICEIEGYEEESKRFSSFEIGANCDKRYV